MSPYATQTCGVKRTELNKKRHGKSNYSREVCIFRQRKQNQPGKDSV
uniref:Uncharacterized protein n=1 Tax=Dulem virus 42 TaxID=3145760 RepID=A0AAU8BA36_9CAUD